MKHWAMNYTECTTCHTTIHKHHGKGLCTACYHRQYKRKPSNLKKWSKDHDKGFEIGLTAGHDQAANAITAILEKWDAHCFVTNNMLYLNIQGKQFKRNLNEF